LAAAKAGVTPVTPARSASPPAAAAAVAGAVALAEAGAAATVAAGSPSAGGAPLLAGATGGGATGAATGPAGGDRWAEVAQAELEHVLPGGEGLEARRVQPEMDRAVQHGDRGGDGTGGADRVLDPVRDRQVGGRIAERAPDPIARLDPAREREGAPAGADWLVEAIDSAEISGDRRAEARSSS